MDKWTWGNELMQNLVIAGVSALWIYLNFAGKAVPDPVNWAFGAILIFLGFKSYKNGGKTNG